MTLPRLSWLLKVHRHAGMRAGRRPEMAGVWVKLKGLRAEIGEVDPNGPTHASWDRRANLIKRDFQTAFDESHTAIAGFICGRRSARILVWTFRHAPALRWPIKGDIYRTVIAWIGPIFPGIIG